MLWVPTGAELEMENISPVLALLPAARLMVEVPVVPAVIEREDGAEEALKPGGGTVTVTLKLCVRGPVVPVTVMM